MGDLPVSDRVSTDTRGSSAAPDRAASARSKARRAPARSPSAQPRDAGRAEGRRVVRRQRDGAIEILSGAAAVAALDAIASAKQPQLGIARRSRRPRRSSAAGCGRRRRCADRRSPGRSRSWRRPACRRRTPARAARPIDRDPAPSRTTRRSGSTAPTRDWIDGQRLLERLDRLRQLAALLQNHALVVVGAGGARRAAAARRRRVALATPPM